MGTSRTSRAPGEQADLNPEAREGVGPGPLLTAAEPAAVAGLVEGAAGAAHRGDATTGRSAAGGRVQAPVPAPRGVGSGAWIPRRPRSLKSSSYSPGPAPAAAERKRTAGRG